MHLHENVLSRLGAGADVLSGTAAPTSLSHSRLSGCASLAHKLPADACIVRPERVEQVEDEDSAFEDHLLPHSRRGEGK